MSLIKAKEEEDDDADMEAAMSVIKEVDLGGDDIPDFAGLSDVYGSAGGDETMGGMDGSFSMGSLMKSKRGRKKKEELPGARFNHLPRPSEDSGVKKPRRKKKNPLKLDPFEKMTEEEVAKALADQEALLAQSARNVSARSRGRF